MLYNGLLFTVTDQGVLVCYDALTGKRLWRKRLPPPSAYRSSLVAGDSKIYATNGTRGLTVVVAAKAEFEQLSTNALGEGTYASPAIAGQSILIRTKSALYRIGGEPRGSTT